ncbi:hypothetical protein MGN01_31310 [Methylobacterium gnaphalii]|uniref:Uncharacterized protein n=1 Tax=Methylobacterium gnaphalii TaxID=1010610 RepID=A0A512JMU3_9HYPH|nr:hypothetical protein MGN01_31310 [Methylobacterium gnaphalii]GLS49986.1 hypothetical protein GCM10007885_28380 [Methylobacterium gnaphalii]
MTGLFLGSLAIAAAVALVTAPITPRTAVARDQGPAPQVAVYQTSLASPVASVPGSVRTRPTD